MSISGLMRHYSYLIDAPASEAVDCCVIGRVRRALNEVVLRSHRCRYCEVAQNVGTGEGFTQGVASAVRCDGVVVFVDNICRVIKQIKGAHNLKASFLD